ncbi:MAG TPA: hypothetical protein VG815_11480 [Chloroflexota bacterium]|nr:hypothetical protein [Chloroflexota bacterium]
MQSKWKSVTNIVTFCVAATLISGAIGPPAVAQGTLNSRFTSVHHSSPWELLNHVTSTMENLGTVRADVVFVVKQGHNSDTGLPASFKMVTTRHLRIDLWVTRPVRYLLRGLEKIAVAGERTVVRRLAAERWGNVLATRRGGKSGVWTCARASTDTPLPGDNPESVNVVPGLIENPRRVVSLGTGRTAGISTVHLRVAFQSRIAGVLQPVTANDYVSKASDRLLQFSVSDASVVGGVPTRVWMKWRFSRYGERLSTGLMGRCKGSAG